MSRGGHNPHAVKPVDLEDIWGDLSEGIRHIYNQQSMSKKRYMELYTYPCVCVYVCECECVHNYVRERETVV